MKRQIILKKENVKKTNCKEGLGLYNEINYINKVNLLYLNQTFAESGEISKSIKKKLSGYKNQDTIKNRLDKKSFITYEELLEKLVISKMRCHYCTKQTKLLHEYRRDEMQWTLDRIDNSLCHSNDNTVICCLQCNMQKRCRNDKKFKFSKQMRIIKQN